MNGDDEVRFVYRQSSPLIHVLVGDEADHMGIALCGDSELFLDELMTSPKDTWLTAGDWLCLLGNICPDCFETLGRVAQKADAPVARASFK